MTAPLWSRPMKSCGDKPSRESDRKGGAWLSCWSKAWQLGCESRGRAPCYIVRALYWLDSDKRTKLVGTFYTGPQPIAAAKGHIGNWQTEVELQLIHDVSRRLTLVSETNLGWDTLDPANNHHTSNWYGTYGMAIIHAHRLLDRWLAHWDSRKLR